MTSKEPSTVISPFDLLPDEIWLRIFSELPVATICLCRVVSKKWYYLSLDEALWQYYSSLLFKPGPLPPRTSSTLHSWESFYRLQLNWQRGTTTKVFNFEAHHNTKVIALKLRGNILVTGSNDNYLRVWNIKTGKKKKEIDVGADIICVDFIEHKDVIACGSYYGDFGCKLVSLSTGKTLGNFIDDQWIGTQCMDMNDEYIILGTHKGIIYVLLWGDGRKVASFNIHSNRVAGVRLLGRNTAMSVSSNGAIDIFNITTNELLHQYILSKTSINICSFDNNVDGRDVLCIAPAGAIYHIRWEDLPPSSFNKDEEEDERIRKIFSKDPIIIYQNNNMPYRLLCAGINSKYNLGVIGSLVSYPPKGHLLILPKTSEESGSTGNEIHRFNKIIKENAENEDMGGVYKISRENEDGIHGFNLESGDIGSGIRGFNKITLPTSDPVVFNILDLSDERIVAGCTRGRIYCFEFSVDQGKEREEDKEQVQNGNEGVRGREKKKEKTLRKFVI